MSQDFPILHLPHFTPQESAQLPETSVLHTVPRKASGDGQLEGWFLVGAVFNNE